MLESGRRLERGASIPLVNQSEPTSGDIGSDPNFVVAGAREHGPDASLLASAMTRRAEFDQDWRRLNALSAEIASLTEDDSAKLKEPKMHTHRSRSDRGSNQAG
jgi:hypothetical protein